MTPRRSRGAASLGLAMAGPLSVLIVRPRATGGLAAHVDHEVRLLQGAGHQVHESAVRIPARPHPVADQRALRTLRREILTHRPGAVHAHGLRAGALAALVIRPPTGMPAATSGVPRPRLVVTLHNSPVGSRAVRAIGAVLLRIIAGRADTVLCVSPDLLDAARAAGAADARHAVIPAPKPSALDSLARAQQEPSAACPASVSDRSGPVPLEVLVVARLAQQKGLDTLLDAAALLRGAADDGAVRIRIAGDGPLRDELQNRIRAENLPVQLLGHCTDVPELLSAADLVVSAAVWEGQPVALQEALRAGRAIVATDAGGTRWVTGDAAHLVPVGDAAALASAVFEHRSPQRRRRAEQASCRRAAQLPTDLELLEQLVDVLVPQENMT